MKELVVIALSAAGACAAALHSKSARSTSRRSNRMGSQQANKLPPRTQSVARLATLPPPSTQPATPIFVPALVAIFLHTVACMWAILRSTHPKSINGDLLDTTASAAWTTTLSLICIASLAIHAAIALLAQQYAHNNAIEDLKSTTSPTNQASRSTGNSIKNLCGVWIKHTELSDSLDPALDLIQLHGIVRMAVSLLKGVEVRITEQGEFKFSVLSPIMWFKITETYPLSGEKATHRRRDLRRGGHVGRVSINHQDKSATLHLEFNEPMGGTVEDTFHCPSPDVLHIDTVMTIRGETVQYRQVYYKRND